MGRIAMGEVGRDFQSNFQRGGGREYMGVSLGVLAQSSSSCRRLSLHHVSRRILLPHHNECVRAATRVSASTRGCNEWQDWGGRRNKIEGLLRVGAGALSGVIRWGNRESG